MCQEGKQLARLLQGLLQGPALRQCATLIWIKAQDLKGFPRLGAVCFCYIYIICFVGLVGKYRKHVLDLGFIGPPRPHVAMRSLCPTNFLRKWPRRLSPAWVVVFAPRLVWVEIVHCIPWFRTSCCTVMLRDGSTVCTAQRWLCVFACVCVIPHAYSADSRWISVKVFYVSFTYFAVLNETWMHRVGASWPNMFLDLIWKNHRIVTFDVAIWCGVCIVSCAMWGVQVLACVDGTPTNTFGISKDMILAHVRAIKTRILTNTECALDHLGMIWCSFSIAHSNVHWAMNPPRCVRVCGQQYATWGCDWSGSAELKAIRESNICCWYPSLFNKLSQGRFTILFQNCFIFGIKQ